MEVSSSPANDITMSDFSSSKEEESLLSDPQPWHQLVREGISRQAYHYSSPQTFSEIYELRERVEKKLIDDSDKFSDRHPESFIHLIFDNDELTMPGVAILATYLRKRKGLDNLFVCKSLEAFQKKLNEISRLEGNTRQALVLTDWPEVDEEQDLKDGEYGADIAHKLAVCIEKTGAQIKIVILDPMAYDDDDNEISPHLIFSAAKDLKYISLEGIGYPLWYIFHSSLNLKNTSIYYSAIHRQNTFTGCETFALEDGIAFLRDPHFFDNIRTKRLLFKEGEAELRLHKINSLPPAFMWGAQSLTLLRAYVQENEKTQDPKQLQAIETLKRKVESHLIEVNGKLQNHYNNQKSLKYHLIADASLEKIPTKKLQQIINETLLTTPRLPLAEDKFPQTLSDLHQWRPVTIIEEDRELPQQA
jgi:hypothetical protein